MIQLPVTTLSAATLTHLDRCQNDIDPLLPYAEQVALARKLWPLHKRNIPFEEVLEKLIAMCPGAQCCCYCENSMADEIEHIFPKDLFPNKTFVWENYLYACGNCNRSKSNLFAVLDRILGAVVELCHPESGPANPPIDGDPLLINPRLEDPSQWIMLSINKDASQLDFLPISDEKESLDYKRAEYSIRILRLNLRTKLGEARKEAYTGYRGRLSEYVLQQSNGADGNALDMIVKELRRASHPTVWLEIQRYRRKGWLKSVDPTFDAYFDSVPQAINW